MKKITCLVLLLAFVIPVLHAAASSPQKGGSLIVCQPAEPPGLDPTANTAAAIDRVVYANIFEGLIKVDSKGRFVPGLATDWSVSPDGLTYDFILRKDVRFHNGEAV